MKTKTDGGPAFPRTVWTGSERNAAHRDVPGISMRDYFAAKAMQGILSNPDVAYDPKDLAKVAVEYADAMLEAREQESQS